MNKLFPINITAFKNRELLILSIGLGLIFFGFNAAEQHFTSFYQTIGLRNLAFQSLAILYASIVIGNFLGPSLVRKLGIKLSLFLGYLAYVFLVLGITLKISIIIYFLSFILGIGSGIAGIAKVDFLRIISPKNNRGEFAGAIESIRTLGGFIGVISVSLILNFLKINQVFILLGLIMILGVALILVLKNVQEVLSHKPEVENTKLMFKLFLSPKILLLLPYNISSGFLLGLVLGVIPAIIEKQFGIFWVGIITSLFHLTLAIVLISAGFLSDIKGRFRLIYCSILVSIIGVILFLNFSNLFIFGIIMILLGLGGSLAGGAFQALMLDTFEERIKESTAVLGNLALIFGIVPSFLLPQVIDRGQLLYLAIFVSIVGLFGVAIFQIKYSPSKNSL